MEKAKKITVEQLRLLNKTPTHRTILWHGNALTVRTLLSIEEISQFVNSVMGGCYDQLHDVFVPEMKDFGFRVNVVSRYACVELPDDIEEQYEILYNTDIYDTICAAVNSAQLTSIGNSIDTLMFRSK